MRYTRLLLCWSIGLLPGAFYAQSKAAGLRENAAIIARIDALNDSSFYSRDPDIKRAYALKTEEMARQINYKKGLSDSHVRLGQAYAAVSNWAASERYHRMALLERRELGNKADIASSCNELGRLYRAQERYDTAIALFRSGLSVMENEAPHVNTLALNTHLGHLYRLRGKYEQAESCLNAAVQQAAYLAAHPPADYTPAELELRLTAARFDMAEFLQSTLHKYPAAKDSLLKYHEIFSARQDTASAAKCLLLLGNNAYETHQLDSARRYIDLGIGLGEAVNKADRYTLYRNRGRVSLDLGKYQQAMADFQTSLAGFEQMGLSQHAAAVRAEIGNLYYEQSRADSAVIYYKMALAQDVSDPVLKGKILYFLSDMLDQSGNDQESQEYTRKYVDLLQGLKTDQMLRAFSDMNLQFLDKNRLLRRLNEQEKQAQRRYSLLGLSIMGLLLALATFAARLHRQKRRLAESTAEIARQKAARAEEEAKLAETSAEVARQKAAQAEKEAKIARQQEQLAIQENLQLLKNKELDTAYARIEGQDAMQKKIGLELHDSVGAMLSTVRLQLSPVDEVLDTMPETARNQYINANRLLSEACEEVRRISHELSSAVLLKFGLKAQLEALADIIAKSGKLQVELATHGLKDRLESKTELNIYRMAQELVNNVIKHAQAKKLTIKVNRFEEMINIMVEDDGKGFDMDKPPESSGLGLQSLEARVHELHGEMQIDSRPNRGTTISIDIPIQKA